MKLWTEFTEWPIIYRSDAALTGLMARTAFGLDGESEVADVGCNLSGTKQSDRWPKLDV